MRGKWVPHFSRTLREVGLSPPGKSTQPPPDVHQLRFVPQPPAYNRNKVGECYGIFRHFRPVWRAIILPRCLLPPQEGAQAER